MTENVMASDPVLVQPEISTTNLHDDDLSTKNTQKDLLHNNATTTWSNLLLMKFCDPGHPYHKQLNQKRLIQNRDGNNASDEESEDKFSASDSSSIKSTPAKEATASTPFVSSRELLADVGSLKKLSIFSPTPIKKGKGKKAYKQPAHVPPIWKMFTSPSPLKNGQRKTTVEPSPKVPRILYIDEPHACEEFSVHSDGMDDPEEKEELTPAPAKTVTPATSKDTPSYVFVGVFFFIVIAWCLTFNPEMRTGLWWSERAVQCQAKVEQLSTHLTANYEQITGHFSKTKVYMREQLAPPCKWIGKKLVYTRSFLATVTLKGSQSVLFYVHEVEDAFKDCWIASYDWTEARMISLQAIWMSFKEIMARKSGFVIDCATMFSNFGVRDHANRTLQDQAEHFLSFVML